MVGGCVLCLLFCYKLSDFVRLFNSFVFVKVLIIDLGLDNDNLEIVMKIINYVYFDGKISFDDVFILEYLIFFNWSKKLLIKCMVDDLCIKEFEVDLFWFDLEDLGFIFLILGSIGILKVILYFYYVLVIMCWFFVGIFELNNDFDIFYSDRVFFWGGGYF